MSYRKTQYCVYFFGGWDDRKKMHVDKNSCDRGDKCGFAHATEEMGRWREEREHQRPVCGNFEKFGKCSWGDSCRYYHDNQIPDLATGVSVRRKAPEGKAEESEDEGKASIRRKASTSSDKAGHYDVDRGRSQASDKAEPEVERGRRQAESDDDAIAEESVRKADEYMNTAYKGKPSNLDHKRKAEDLRRENAALDGSVESKTTFDEDCMQDLANQLFVAKSAEYEAKAELAKLKASNAKVDEAEIAERKLEKEEYDIASGEAAQFHGLENHLCETLPGT
jgi:hypothetical protein